MNITPGFSVARCSTVALALFGFTANALGDPLISEFMASNVQGIVDQDGDNSSWIELYNPDAVAVNLAGWYLADKTTNLTKWKIPAVTLPPGGYLVIFASNKNYTNPTAPLATNFSLSTSDTFVALVKPDGVTIASQYLNFPQQFNDISYGVTQPTDGSAPRTGYLRLPSPGTRNPDVIYLPDTVAFSTPPGLFSSAFALTLTGAAAGETIRYVVAAPSSANGASVAEPTSTSTPYTGPIAINSTVIVRAEIFSADNKSRGLPATAQFVQLAGNAASFASSLPIIVLDEHGLGPLVKDSIYHPAWLYVFTPPATGPATLTGTPALVTPTGMTVHGNFSANFPKKSYGLSLVDTLGYDNCQPLLGLDKDRQWEIYSPWSTDRSYIRNIFVYALSNRIGRWAPRTQLVEMFVNQDNDGLTTLDYYGIGVLVDRLKISNDRININSIGNTDLTAPAVTGGYLIKIDPIPDLTHYNFVSDRGVPSFLPGTTGIIVESPDAGSLKPAQQTYIRGYIQTMENSLFSARAGGFAKRDYLDYVDVPSWVDHHLMKTFFGDVDAFWHSEYLYKDLNGKMVSGPVWDFDGSMGYDPNDPRDINPLTWDTTGGRDVWNYDWWGPLLHDPEVMQAWIDRWQGLRKNEFSTANLAGLADSIAAQIPAATAARDAARWPDNVSRYGGSFLTEVAHLKDWITARAAWIDSQWLGVPTVTTSGANVIFTAPPGAQLVYTLDGSDPRALGGAIPPNATVASSPLSLAATTNVHVRSYNANLINTYPGSTWSSVVGGPSSSAVLPRSRLSNLSVLTNLAAGDTVTMGFVVGPSGTGGSKPLLARAAGPSLAQLAVPTPMADPFLQLYAGSTLVTQNDDWGGGSSLTGAFTQLGAFPFISKTSKDSAVLSPGVASGGNSVIVSGVAGSNGNVIAELYDATPGASFTPATPRLINVSVLKNISDVLTVGFVVGPIGSPAKKVVVRAVGPGLAGVGLTSGTLPDPQLTLFDATNAVVGSNDNWGGTAALTAAFASVGAFVLPANSLDAAIVVSLAPGGYSVQVKGAAGTSGLALVEVYEVP